MATKQTALRRELGTWGEEQAAARLQASGYRVVARNWRCSLGEVDLIAWSPDTALCFIEVRTSRSMRYGGAIASITARKRQKLTLLAQAYLHGRTEPPRIRFDIYALQKTGRQWDHQHIQNAFAAEEF